MESFYAFLYIGSNENNVSILVFVRIFHLCLLFSLTYQCLYISIFVSAVSKIKIATEEDFERLSSLMYFLQGHNAQYLRIEGVASE